MPSTEILNSFFPTMRLPWRTRRSARTMRSSRGRAVAEMNLGERTGSPAHIGDLHQLRCRALEVKVSRLSQV